MELFRSQIQTCADVRRAKIKAAGLARAQVPDIDQKAVQNQNYAKLMAALKALSVNVLARGDQEIPDEEKERIVEYCRSLQRTFRGEEKPESQNEP